jgi:triosephosphate isomerase
MNPQTVEEAKAIINGIKRTSQKVTKVETVVCPPFVFISAIGRQPSVIRIGAQDTFWLNPAAGKGPYTGEVSPDMLKMLGVKYVIIGHSERRQNFGETNEMVNKKIKAAFESGLKVILCVGEKERDTEHNYLKFIRQELEEGLAGIKKVNFKNLIVAYEPIWAIGKKGEDADTPEGVLQMNLYIRKILQPIVGKELTHDIPVIYGGSAEPENAEALLKEGKVQGFLVGHASLKPEQFNEILKIANGN